MSDLRHLPLDLREIAAADNAQRIAFIRGQWWIGYPQAQAALDLLGAAIENEPGRVRPQCFLLLGPTNNGKSMIIEKFRRDHTPPALPGPIRRSSRRPASVFWYWRCHCRIRTSQIPIRWTYRLKRCAGETRKTASERSRALQRSGGETKDSDVSTVKGGGGPCDRMWSVFSAC